MLAFGRRAALRACWTLAVGPPPRPVPQTVCRSVAPQAEAAAAPAAEAPGIRKGPAPEQATAIKAAIAAATTLEEVRRLEEALKTGHLPSEVAVGAERPAGAGAMEEG